MSSNNYSNLFDIISHLKNKNIYAQDFFLYQLPSQEYLFIASRNWISGHGLTELVQDSTMNYIFTDDKQIYNLLYFLRKRKGKIFSRKKTNIKTKDLQKNGMDLFKIDQETGDKILGIMNPSFLDNSNTQEYPQESNLKTNKKYLKNLASIIEMVRNTAGFNDVLPQFITGKQNKKDIPFEAENTEVNPFHHMFWKIVSASWYEKPVAQNFVQEGNVYTSMDEANQAVDSANIQISQRVSGMHPQKTIKGMAYSLLDEFYNHGLYMVRKNNDGKFVAYKEKIPSYEYNAMKEVYTKFIDQKLDAVDKNDAFINVESYFSKNTDHIKENFIPRFAMNATTLKSINRYGYKIKKNMDDTIDSLHNYYQDVHPNFNQKHNQNEIFTKLGNQFSSNAIFLKNKDDKLDNHFFPLFKNSLETYVMAKRAGQKMEEEANYLIGFLNEYYRYIKPESNKEYTQKNSQFIHQLNSSLINRPRSKSQTYQTIIENNHSTVVQQQPVQNSQETLYNQPGKIYRRNIIDSINSSVL